MPTKRAGKKSREKGAACRQRVPAKNPGKKSAECRQKVPAKKCSADKSTGKHRAFAQKKIKTKGERQQAWVI
ncbi:MAG: hypothetical protein PHV38_06035 [Eubacteriales bacterium]|nr:hypothetical protein [Eubacteriales bacterium]